MSETVLEVIACTLDDAREAQRGGADRLEIISGLELGGLTPPGNLVKEIKANVSLPLRVMIRESSGFETLGDAEILVSTSINQFHVGTAARENGKVISSKVAPLAELLRR